MKWKILKIGRGVLIERTIKAIEATVRFEFEGIDEGYTAIFKREDGLKEYSAVTEGFCNANGAFFKNGSTFRVAVSKFKGDKPILCESIKRINCEGASFIVPDDNDIPSEMANVLVENDDIRSQMSEMRKKFEELLARVEELEGFDI